MFNVLISPQAHMHFSDKQIQRIKSFGEQGYVSLDLEQSALFANPTKITN